MKHKFVFKSALLFIAGIAFVTCTKKEIQGPKGDPGTPGQGGNVDITNSGIFTIGTTQWQPTSTDSSVWNANYNSSLITKEVVDNGSLKLYYQIGTVWHELPHIDEDIYTQYGYAEGVIKLTHSSVHGEKLTRPLAAPYRIVVLSKSGRQVLPPIDVQQNLISVANKKSFN